MKETEVQAQSRASGHNAGQRWSLATLAVMVTCPILLFYWTTPSRYYTFDSIALLIPDRDLNSDHFGYQLLLRGLVAVHEVLGRDDSIAYRVLQQAQSTLVAIGFGLYFLSILSPMRDRERPTRWEAAFAAALTLLAGFSGGSMRFASILEDYVLSATLIIAGMASWRWLREGSARRYIVTILLWCTAMSFDLTLTLVCAPPALYLAWHAIARRQWLNATITVLMNAAFLASALVLLLSHRGQYSHPAWGGHGVRLSDLRAFAVGLGRTYVYLVQPSMPLVSSAAGKVLLFAALGSGILLSLVLAVGLFTSQGGLDAIARAALIGLACRVSFLFWWIPGNSEFLILPFLMLLSISARSMVQGGRRVGKTITLTSIAAALMVALANIFLVGLPTHGQSPTPYLDAMRQVASDAQLPSDSRLGLLCDDEHFSVSYNAKASLMSRHDLVAFPHVDVFTFSPRGAPLRSISEARAWVDRRMVLLRDFLAAHRYAVIMSSEKSDEYRGAEELMDSPNHRIAPDLPNYLGSLWLPHIVTLITPITPGKPVGQFRTWHRASGAQLRGTDVLGVPLLGKAPKTGL